MDGEISFSEFLQTLTIMTHGSIQQNLVQIFRFFDTQSDGVIDLLEFQEVVSDLFEKEDNVANEAFSELDENNAGQVSLEEFIQSSLKSKKCSTMVLMKVVSLFLDK